MDTSLAHIRRRSQAYWYVDGFSEILGGVVLTVTASVWLAGRWWLADSPLAGWVGEIKDVVLVIGFVLASSAIYWLKARYTYPRTGQITYRRASRKTQGLLVVAIVLLAAAVTVGSILAFFAAPGFRTWLITSMPPVLILGCGLGAGLLFFGWAIRTGLNRFYILSGFVSLLGLALVIWYNQSAVPITVPDGLLADPFAQLPVELGHQIASAFHRAYTYVGVLFGVVGMALVVSGLIVCWGYLRNTQRSAEEKS